MVDKNIIDKIAVAQNIKVNQINAALKLLQEGNTIPFIARYRKEATGALNEEQIQAISKEYQYALSLKQRKEDVIRLIEEKGLMTEELKKKILSSTKIVEVEDLYRPYKEKKKTKATDAIAKGLEPLAKMIMSQNIKGTLDSLASKFISEDVPTIEDALQGSQYIIAEYISDNARYRSWIRRTTLIKGNIKSKLKKNAQDDMKVYENYYEYEESIKTIKSHRILALNRAEKEKVLTVKVVAPKDEIIAYLEKNIIKVQESVAYELIVEAIKDSYKRLISPSIEREIRNGLSEKAEEGAIDIFSENLRKLLLQSPIKDKMVLGVDPAFRTGCKLAIVDETGKFIDKNVIYPHPPKNQYNKAKDVVKKLINKYPIDIIAIGNGTASRETEAFIAEVISEVDKELFYIIVNEAGASVYSASKEARKEFPDFEVEERSAVSIARRLQDPLAELVKINPKSIGVGQYQHDVTQSKLNEKLRFVVETVVNQVGVNVNTASVELLSYVSGLTDSTANNIVLYRNEIGKFTDRNQIKNVKKLGKKSYQQSIGFLRVQDANNILDSTPIHPESYDIAMKLLLKTDLSIKDINTDKISTLKEVSKENLSSELNIDEYTLEDIIGAFLSPNRDPRDDVQKPILKKGVLKLNDLTKGMKLQGTVRNVVDFGAFVDIGLKNDGLIHISKLSNKYVKHPLDIVSVGQIIDVFVDDIDTKRGKVSLSMLEVN